MGTTTWHPRTNFDQRSWVLTSGEVIHEPALEQTASGRKVRIVGTDITAWAKDVDSLILQAVQQTAAGKGERVWRPLDKSLWYRNNTINFDPGQTPCDLHLLNKDLAARTQVWWHFRNDELDLDAYLTVEAYRISRQVHSSQRVDVKVTTPRLVPHPGPSPEYRASCDAFFTAHVQDIPNHDYTETRSWIGKNPPPNWEPADVLGNAQYGNARSAAEALLEKIRQIEELEYIDLPDLRDPAKPGWITCELVASNVNGTVTSDLAEYLDGAPSIDEALRLYTELQTVLSGLGIVLGDKTENEFQSALLGGNKEALHVPVGAIAGENGDGDHAHSLSMHLPSGTFVVNCSLRKATMNEVAEKWEEALTVASLTGEEDALLAYAREFNRTHNEERARRIMKERTQGLKKKK